MRFLFSNSEALIFLHATSLNLCTLTISVLYSPLFYRLMPAVQVKIEDFSLHRIIGRGGFGEVYGCRKVDTGKRYWICEYLCVYVHECVGVYVCKCVCMGICVPVCVSFTVCLAVSVYAFHNIGCISLFTLSYTRHQVECTPWSASIKSGSSWSRENGWQSTSETSWLG